MDISVIGNKLKFNKSKENVLLIKRIKKRDMAPLMKWMDNKKDKYYKIGWSYLYNHYDIEDVFQSTIIKVFENIRSLREEKYFETWVTSIFINECKAILRKNKREITTDYNKGLEGSYYDNSNIEFKEIINSLDELYREVIVLKYMVGYSQEDISQMLNIPTGTVKSRIYRGLKILRDKKNREVL